MFFNSSEFPPPFQPLNVSLLSPHIQTEKKNENRFKR
jgi:hypothetical protein